MDNTWTCRGVAAILGFPPCCQRRQLGLRSALTRTDSTAGFPAQKQESHEEKCRDTIVAVSGEICSALPFFFPSNPEHIHPRLATLLGWPIAVAVSTQAVPNIQRLQLKKTLKTVAMVLGDSVLQVIAEGEEFKF